MSFKYNGFNIVTLTKTQCDEIVYRCRNGNMDNVIAYSNKLKDNNPALSTLHHKGCDIACLATSIRLEQIN
jgi:hypothetical protein